MGAGGHGYSASQGRLPMPGLIPPSTARRRPSTIDFIAERWAGCGVGRSRRWPEPIPAMSTPSTARRLKRTAQRLEEKRGRNAGDWPLARRGRTTKIHAIVDSQPTHHARSDARPTQRPPGCNRADQRRPPRRSLAGDAAYDSDLVDLIESRPVSPSVSASLPSSQALRNRWQKDQRQDMVGDGRTAITPPRARMRRCRGFSKP